MRRGADRRRDTARCAPRPRSGAPARVGALRRPGRLHAALGYPRRRGGSGAPLALLRLLPADHLALRRHRREVHRRCGHGRLGDADRDRRRRGAGRAGGARPRRRGLGARAGGRRGGAAGASRRAHRRGRGDGRRRGPGDGRRRPRQHGVPDPGRRRARQRLRRRYDPADDRADDRLRGSGLVRVEGQGRARAALEGAPGGVRVAWVAQVGRARGTVRRPRPRAEPDQGPLPHLGRRAPGAPDLGDRDRRHWQVAPRVGVLQVLRRHRRDRPLAPRPLPALRRGRHLLGAGRHGADALPDRRGRGAGQRRREAARGARGAHPRRRGASLRRAAPWAAARARRARRTRPAGAVRRVAALLRAIERHLPDGARLRGHAVGRREPAGLRRVPARLVAEPPAAGGHARAAGAAREAPDLGSRPAELHLALPRAAAARGDGGAARRARAGPARGGGGADPGARRRRAALRRRDGADAARPRAARPAGRSVRPGGPGRGARGPGDAARADRRSARRPRPRRAQGARGRRGARQDVHAGGRLGALGDRRRPARAAARGARPQGGARRPGRPALARARPVRLPAGPRPIRRLRDAVEARAPDTPSGRGRVPDGRVRR